MTMQRGHTLSAVTAARAAVGMVNDNADDAAVTVADNVVAALAAGQWSGSLQDNGDDGVPKVATGTFHSTYSTSGRIIGAFGATKG